MNFMKLFGMAMACVAALGFTSCNHKELCFHHDNSETLRLVFDWRDAPDAAPVGMVAFFYPEDPEMESYRFDFDNRFGGEISLAPGRYRVIAYNNDTSGVLFRGMDSHGEHTAFTREGGLFEPVGQYGKITRAPRARDTENESISICPDEMWGCSEVEVNVPVEGNVIYLYPHELTCVYTYEIRNVKNLDVVTQMSASLSGMSPELRFCDEELGHSPVTLPFEANAADDKTITGRFITFGHHEDLPNPHKMMLYVWTAHGKQYAFGTDDKKFNLTDQVHAAPNRRRVHLIIDGLEIPRGEEGNEFDPSADDWQDVNVDVPM